VTFINLSAIGSLPFCAKNIVSFVPFGLKTPLAPLSLNSSVAITLQPLCLGG